MNKWINNLYSICHKYFSHEEINGTVFFLEIALTHFYRYLFLFCRFGSTCSNMLETRHGVGLQAPKFGLKHLLGESQFSQPQGTNLGECGTWIPHTTVWCHLLKPSCIYYPVLQWPGASINNFLVATGFKVENKRAFLKIVYQTGF